MAARGAFQTTALLAAAACLSTAAPARASVSIAIGWQALLERSAAAIIGTAADSRADWESGRIYTYTRVHVDRAVAGAVPAGADIWVRTMGGIVGNVGQSVAGEPVLLSGQRSLLFLHAGPGESFEVTARAQGQYLLVARGRSGTPVLHALQSGALVLPARARPVLAQDKLHDRPAEDAAREIAARWSATHPH